MKNTKPNLPFMAGRFQMTLTIVLALFCCVQVSRSQCANIDFSLQNFTNWNGAYGTYTNADPAFPLPCPNPGFLAGRHEIISNPGTDPNSNNVVPYQAPGTNVTARLGNLLTGYDTQELTYTFVVDPNSELLIYQFAVFIQDPGHTPAQQPRLRVDVTANGNVIIPCTDNTYYYASGQQSNPYVPFFNGPGSWRYCNWTTVGVDLSNYSGQSVTLRFQTADCGQGGHAGYAYVRAQCMPLNIDVEYCQGDTVANLQAPPGFFGYQWLYNNNPIPGATSASHSVNNPQQGNYQVELTSITGCQATLNTSVLPIAPYADFVSATSCDGSVQFTDSSTAMNSIVTGWHWSFGDGDSSVQQSPLHQYNQPGTYNVTLLAYATGCSKPDTIVFPVTTNNFIEPDFTSPFACSLTQAFFDSTTFNTAGQVSAWQWNFGDNGSSTQQNPNHTYSQSGTYNVTLIVTDTAGCTDTITRPVNIGAIPVASFTTANECANEAFSFVDGSTPFQNSTISNWQWNFGDNGTSNQQNPNYTYGQAGTYNVQLIVTGAEGCTDTVTQQVTAYDLPQADFSVDKTCLGFNTQFTNLSTVVNPYTITNYVWIFGNSGIPINTQTNPSAVFPSSGTYQVTLVAVSSAGCTDTITLPVIINPQPQVSFNGDDLEGCLPHTVQFTNTSFSAGGIDYVYWSYGDGTPLDTINDGSHVYTQPGVYDVTVTVVAPGGCDSTLVIPAYITAHPQPDAQFTVENDCFMDTIDVVNTSSISMGNIDTYQWTVTGITNSYSGTDNTQQPGFEGLAVGDYELTLVVGTQAGCKDTLTTNFTVYANPVADFDVISECYYKNIFVDISTSPAQLMDPAWDIDGDGFPDDYGSPLEVVFLDSVDKNITLFVTDANGCRADTTKFVEIKGEPTLDQVPNILVVGSTVGNESFDFEKFAPGLNECIDYTFSVFNRWGLKVFETINTKTNPDMNCTSCFRGMTGGGDGLTEGTYYYIMKGENGFNREGFITLVVYKP